VTTLLIMTLLLMPNWIKSDEGGLPDLLCLPQLTSPLRTSEDIDGTVGLAAHTGADSAFSVSAVNVHPEIMYRLDGVGQQFLPPVEGYRRSQDMDALFYTNGAVYMIRPESFMRCKIVISPEASGCTIPPQRSVDIDDETDFVCAEALMKRYQPMRIQNIHTEK